MSLEQLLQMRYMKVDLFPRSVFAYSIDLDFLTIKLKQRLSPQFFIITVNNDQKTLVSLSPNSVKMMLIKYQLMLYRY